MANSTGTSSANSNVVVSGGVKYTYPARNVWASRLLRSSGPEPFDSETFVPGGVVNVQKNINLQRPLIGVWFRVRGTLNVTTALTASAAEAPYTLFRQIKIFGSHTTLGSQNLVQHSSETLASMLAFFEKESRSISWGTWNGQNLQVYNSGIGVTAVGAYNFDVKFFVPAYPYGCSDVEKMLHLWDARSWTSTLQIQLTCGDTTAFGTGGAATLNAYGLSSGSPSIDILLEYANLSPQVDAAIAKAVCVRQSNIITSVLNTSATQARLALLQNQKTTKVFTRVGTVETGTNNVYATLSDSILEQTVLRTGSKPIKNLQYNEITRTNELLRNGGSPASIVGILPITFDAGSPNSNPHAAFRGDQLSPATQFDIASNITGTANAIGEVVQEIIFGESVVAQSA